MFKQQLGEDGGVLCMSLFMGVLYLNFVIASLPHVRGCIDFRGGLISLLIAAGPLLSQGHRYLLITPFFRMES